MKPENEGGNASAPRKPKPYMILSGPHGGHESDRPMYLLVGQEASTSRREAIKQYLAAYPPEAGAKVSLVAIATDDWTVETPVLQTTPTVKF